MEKTVTASAFARNFGRYRDEAATGEIVTVTIRGRVIGGFLSARQLEEYRRLKRRDREGAAAQAPAAAEPRHGTGQERGAAALLVARKLNAGRRRAIAPADLTAALRSGKPAKALRAHLGGFFEEIPIELVHDTILEEGLDYDRLVGLAGELGIAGETVDWLEEMAGDSLAASA